MVGTDEYHLAHDHVRLASLAAKKRLWWRNAIINGMFIASWFFFATILSLYNKWMFSPEHFGFPYPLFVTTLHMFVQFAIAAFLRFTWPRHFKPDRRPNARDYGLKAAPTAITTGLDIGLSNLSLKTITLSFYTMVKSSSLIFVLLFAFIFRLERFSLRLVGVISLITAGVLLMVATESHFVLGGFALVLSASALGGLRWSLTQLLLRNREMGMDNPAATLFWLAPVMGATLAVISMVVDGWINVFRSDFFDGSVSAVVTVLYLVAPGVVATCMVLSEFYIIRRAGVVPMSIAGIAKEVTTITISAWVFGDELSPLNITGVAITICGIALYTYHKYRKSMDSPVPLDAHGNPIDDADDDALDAGGHVELGETDRLAARMSMDDFDNDDTSTVGGRTLFSVGDDELDRAGAEELRGVTAAKLGGLRRSSSDDEDSDAYPPRAGKKYARSEGYAESGEYAGGEDESLGRQSTETERAWHVNGDGLPHH